MKILFTYLKKYQKLLVFTLLLAAVNQGFSMADPLIMGKMVNYVTLNKNPAAAEFFQVIVLFLLALIGVAMVSRIAKNFQDYFLNVIIQKTGADIYTDGIRHSLELPYEVFEDQRSGETLGKLQKVRSDVERFITAAINVIFISAIGLVFVMIYAFYVHWSIAPAFLLTVPLLGIISP